MIAAMERQSLIGAARALDFWKSEAWPSYPDPLTARCCWRARSLPAFAPAALKPHLARLPLEEAALDGVVNAMMKCAPHLMGMRWWPITHTHTHTGAAVCCWLEGQSLELRSPARRVPPSFEPGANETRLGAI